MKKFLILLLAAVILFSGCVGQKTVKNGDKISVDYTGSLENGKVFDTSIESEAKEKNLFAPGREYKPLQFNVGKGEVIKGFDEGVVGMMVGETKILTIPPEKGYGQIDPRAIQVLPIIQDVPGTITFPKVLEVPLYQFEGTFGQNHTVGDVVTLQRTNVNLTVQNVSTNVTLSYNLKVGNNITSSGAPWNETVLKIDDKNITIKHDVKKNETIQFFHGAPWNSTVINVSNDNITLRHNVLPDAELPTMFGGMMKVHFNETSIILDQNHKLAGKTLIFSVTLRSIDK
ncbi:MAG: FKBP-type peptidyl-prolyl cis-trans isomerase [Candidatus Methanoperedens sp.]|nr:FKBP-type peptidyl-prolyl cis-trans isomerase [Candidatus Methanoperedens sp.]